MNQLKGFPKEVKKKMLKRQVEQGNKKDISVFKEIKSEIKIGGGFNWGVTIEGIDFWTEVILNKNFDLFFKKYPKKSKSKKYKITDGQIKELLEIQCTQDKDDFLKELFPEVFEVEKVEKVELKAGNWYKTTFSIGQNFFCFDGTFDEENNPNGYGFDATDKWRDINDGGGWGFFDNSPRKATIEEIEDALKKEATKRYKVGDFVFDNWINILHEIEELGRFKFNHNSFFVLTKKNSSVCLMTNGKWAESIPTISKEEAEKGLGKKIV